MPPPEKSSYMGRKVQSWQHGTVKPAFDHWELSLDSLLAMNIKFCHQLTWTLKTWLYIYINLNHDYVAGCILLSVFLNIKSCACDAESSRWYYYSICSVLIYTQFIPKLTSLWHIWPRCQCKPLISSTNSICWVLCTPTPTDAKGKLNRRRSVEREIKVIACAGGRINC